MPSPTVTSGVRPARYQAGKMMTDALALLAGEPGLTPEQQGQRLDSAATMLDAAATLLRDAAELARTRDFAAHMAAKQAAGEGALVALDGQGFVTPEDQMGDVLAMLLMDPEAG